MALDRWDNLKWPWSGHHLLFRPGLSESLGKSFKRDAQGTHLTPSGIASLLEHALSESGVFTPSPGRISPFLHIEGAHICAEIGYDPCNHFDFEAHERLRDEIVKFFKDEGIACEPGSDPKRLKFTIDPKQPDFLEKVTALTKKHSGDVQGHMADMYKIHFDKSLPLINTRDLIPVLPDNTPFDPEYAVAILARAQRELDAQVKELGLSHQFAAKMSPRTGRAHAKASDEDS